jgi:porphobilinogen synthase
MYKYPNTRLRRNRKAQWSRDLSATINVTPLDLIYPIFVHEADSNQPIEALPDQFRLSIQGAVSVAKHAKELGIPAIAIFPVIDKSLKTDGGIEALNSNNLMARTIDAIKSKVPELGIIADVALDPYTTHGHDGIIDDKGYVMNDVTNDILCQMALSLIEAGADLLAPSDMMDGRIITIRQTLESAGWHNAQIISYAAKFASSFYGPFRNAIGASSLKGQSDKKTYQLDFRSKDAALMEVMMDINEGADMIIIKPGLPYLDIINEVSKLCSVPMLAYHVSGEYAMLKWGAKNNSFKYEDALVETVFSFKRAGCSGIITYGALELARFL